MGPLCFIKEAEVKDFLPVVEYYQMTRANKLYIMILTSCNQQSSIDFNGKTLICTIVQKSRVERGAFLTVLLIWVISLK